MNNFPTHRHITTGDIVFPEGYPTKELELLEETYWPDRLNSNEVRQGKINGFKAEASRRILEKYPAWKQANGALEPDEPWVGDMRKFIKSVRDCHHSGGSIK